MEKILKIYLFIILSLFIFSVCSNRDKHNKNESYSVLITMGNLNHDYRYKLVGEVVFLTKKERVIQNFSLKITNTHNNKFTNYLLPTIKTPVIEIKDIDKDLSDDIFMIYYSGGMHVSSVEQLIFSTKYDRLLIYNAEETGVNIYSNTKVNYLIKKYPVIHNFFRTNNIQNYESKFKIKLDINKFTK